MGYLLNYLWLSTAGHQLLLRLYIQTLVKIEDRMNIYQNVSEVESQVPPHKMEHKILPQKRPSKSQFSPSVEQHSSSSVELWTVDGELLGTKDGLELGATNGKPCTVISETTERICQGTTSVSSI